MFIKKNKKPCCFLKMYGRNPQVFEFLREDFPKLAKILCCPQNFSVLHLKM